MVAMMNRGCISFILLLICFHQVIATIVGREEERYSKILSRGEGSDSENGVWLNGVTLNGENLNGFTLNGINLNGVTLNGIEPNGIEINGLELNGLQLNGLQLNGLQLNSNDSNRIAWNGISLNGFFINGGGWNGENLNGGGWNGMAWNGMAWNGGGWNGENLNGGGWNGGGWNGENLNSNATSGILSSLSLSGVVMDERTASTLKTVNVTGGSFLLQGAALNSPSIFKGAILINGTFIPQVWAEGSSLKAQVGGKYITGVEWKGAALLFSIVIFTNETHIVEYLYAVGVQDVKVDEKFSDLLLWNLTSPGDLPFCSAGLATIIPNAFWDSKNGNKKTDNGLFTIACAGGALYKCSVISKYRPHASHGKPSVSLSNHHQACVRMLRADYCGDGVSHTVNGKLIDVWDSLRPAINTRENSTWPLEAYWSPTGADCFNSPRIKGNFDGWCGKIKLPTCTSRTPNKYVANSFPPA